MARIVAIDYLRAFFSVCVVLAHLGYISPSLLFDKNKYLFHKFDLSDFLNFYVLLLAVPIFFITSNYLFYIKEMSKNHFIKNVTRIVKLSIFWIIAFQAFMQKGWEIIYLLPTTASELIIFVMSGGHTKYYFFISLLILTAITYFSSSISKPSLVASFIISTLAVALIPIYSIQNNAFILSTHWSLLNFIPYPFAAILVFSFNKDQRLFYAALFTITGFFFATLDWFFYIDLGFFKINDYAIPAYTRPSLIFLSMSILLIALETNPKEIPIINFMSKNSLALYCIHPFYIEPVLKVFHDQLALSLLVVLFLSYFTAFVLKFFIRQELIM
jgi:hypothetical protein